MLGLMHAYILVSQKKYKSECFVNNFLGVVKYINTSPFDHAKNDLKGLVLWVKKIILV